tara:strand:+ start:17891 stop:18430 length:540 start_codon:yes stop_codon:yes gene_type:complete
MRQLVNVPNVDAPDADFPKGRVRDKVGATIGTTYSEILHGDVIQFFQKLVIDAGISENNLPDNVTNGYQLLAALDAEILKQKAASSTIVNLESGTAMSVGSPTITIAATTFDRMIYIVTGGATTAGFDASIDLGAAVAIQRLRGFGMSASILLPANTVGTINWVASTGDVNVNAQQIGV